MEDFPVISSILSPQHICQFVAKSYGLVGEAFCTLLKAGINHSYLVTDGTRKYVFRVYSSNWRTDLDINEEIRLLNVLREVQVSVSYPLKDIDGEYIQLLRAPEGTRQAVLFSFAEGTKQLNFSADLHFSVGQIMARIHQTTLNLKLHRVTYTPTVVLEDSLAYLRKYLPPDSAELSWMVSAQSYLLNEIKKADFTQLREGAVHLDIWFDNMNITKDGQITIFDFDFCGNGWLCYDLAYYILQLHSTEKDVVSSDVNAIDPGLFKDSNGKVYMTYGSFSGGIGVVEIDPSTAKRKSGASIVKVAGGSGANWEAPYLIKEGSYYYLFVNRGACCNGVNSTYYITVGRSTSPTGPFSGWRTVLSTSGKYIGPGHFGLLRHNGSNFVSIHYYDGSDNGNAKLDILNMGIGSDGWPFLTRDWLASGTYRLTNVNSGKVWDAWGCTGVAGQAVAQGTWSGANCQKWNLTPVGNGAYRITSLTGGRSVDISNCNSGNGATLSLWDWLNNDCQKFRIERTSTGSHVLTPLNTNRVVEVPGASTANGVQLATYDYNGNNCQKWNITTP